MATPNDTPSAAEAALTIQESIWNVAALLQAQVARITELEMDDGAGETWDVGTDAACEIRRLARMAHAELTRIATIAEQLEG